MSLWLSLTLYGSFWLSPALSLAPISNGAMVQLLVVCIQHIFVNIPATFRMKEMRGSQSEDPEASTASPFSEEFLFQKLFFFSIFALPLMKMIGDFDIFQSCPFFHIKSFTRTKLYLSLSQSISRGLSSRSYYEMFNIGNFLLPVKISEMIQ